MDKLNLRGIILKLHDRLSDDDRKRLHFFLGNDIPRRIQDDQSPGGTLALIEYLFHQDKINEQDMTLLINAFNEIQCSDIAQLLKKHMAQLQSNKSKISTESAISLIPTIIAPDKENCPLQCVLIDQKNYCTKNNFTVNNNNNTNVNPVTVVLGNQPKYYSQSKRKYLFKIIPITQKCTLIFTLLFIILAGLVLCGCIWIVHLRVKYSTCLNEQVKNAEIIQNLKNIISIKNANKQQLNN